MTPRTDPDEPRTDHDPDCLLLDKSHDGPHMVRADHPMVHSPQTYECSACDYVMWDAALGDVEDHWRDSHRSEAAQGAAPRAEGPAYEGDGTEPCLRCDRIRDDHYIREGVLWCEAAQGAAPRCEVRPTGQEWREPCGRPMPCSVHSERAAPRAEGSARHETRPTWGEPAYRCSACEWTGDDAGAIGHERRCTCHLGPMPEPDYECPVHFEAAPRAEGLDVDTLRAIDRWIHTTPGVAFTPEAHASLYAFYRSHGYDPHAYPPHGRLSRPSDEREGVTDE